jgi:hypothetical protein
MLREVQAAPRLLLGQIIEEAAFDPLIPARLIPGTPAVTARGRRREADRRASAPRHRDFRSASRSSSGARARS